MVSNKVYVVMGVSGAGKSSVGQALSKSLKLPFYDGDDYHPQANIDKMRQGIPLEDSDRWAWLKNLNLLAKEALKKEGAVMVCSALKEVYRQELSKDFSTACEWIYLKGNYELILERIQARAGHFMPPELLQSQFNTLEAPKNAIEIDVSAPLSEIIKELEMTFNERKEFGLFGLGVMGKSLARNLARNGFRIALFNRHLAGVEEGVAINFKDHFPELKEAAAFDEIAAFVNALGTPRKIMLMVNAGPIVDHVIEDLLPFLSKGDILIDGGNSNYKDSKRRLDYLNSRQIQFIGAGVSGGEEGALTGPSIMPGGSKEAYAAIQPYLEAIAAKGEDGKPCCSYIGEEGSGHFVKMVHNGIEYVEMELLAEMYAILTALGKNPAEIASIFETWKSVSNSYLLEITIDILRKKEGDTPLVEKILDVAANKGTGNWTTIATAELGVPSTLIANALFARFTSSFKTQRQKVAAIFEHSPEVQTMEEEDLLKAYHFARIINHYQGFQLISEAAKTYQWNISLSELARVWTNGCIIKSDLMKKMVPLLKESNDLLDAPTLQNQLLLLKPIANKVVAQCILSEIPTSSLSESINFLNQLKTDRSAANIIQAQRDYFGAHTYKRINDPLQKNYHTIWT
ncbi:NADP-dependent phosphogluconate dehydrogenase [Flavobacteriaceae bacterium]|nr:NADP-dependent phosphogluconate dehydrogenase [Flavobacteriaceae bacterium]